MKNKMMPKIVGTEISPMFIFSFVIKLFEAQTLNYTKQHIFLYYLEDILRFQHDRWKYAKQALCNRTQNDQSNKIKNSSVSYKDSSK